MKCIVCIERSMDASDHKFRVLTDMRGVRFARKQNIYTYDSQTDTQTDNLTAYVISYARIDCTLYTESKQCKRHRGKRRP